MFGGSYKNNTRGHNIKICLHGRLTDRSLAASNGCTNGGRRWQELDMRDCEAQAQAQPTLLSARLNVRYVGK